MARRESQAVARDICWRPVTSSAHYEISTVTWRCDAAGRRVDRALTRGRFTRSPGRTGDVFTWHTFEHSDGNLDEADGFTYEFDLEAEGTSLPVDTSTLPRTRAAWSFYGSLLDAHVQFDLLRTRRFGRADELGEPGSSVSRTRCELVLERWPPVSDILLDDSRAEAHTDRLGATMRNGIGCHVLFFRAENVFIVAATPASTRYSGHIFISEDDLSLVEGELFEFGGGGGVFFNREVRLNRTL